MLHLPHFPFVSHHLSIEKILLSIANHPHLRFPVFISESAGNSSHSKNTSSTFNAIKNSECIYTVNVAEPVQPELLSFSGTACVCHGLRLTMHSSKFIIQVAPVEITVDWSCKYIFDCWRRRHQLYIFEKTNSTQPHHEVETQLQTLSSSINDLAMTPFHRKHLRKRRDVSSYGSGDSIPSNYGNDKNYILELYLVADQALSRSYYNKYLSYEPLIGQVKLMLRDVNEAFSVFNVTVVVVRFEIWKNDVVSLVYDDDQILYQLEKFKRSYHARSIRHDCLHALLGREHEDGKSALQGKSYGNTMCAATRCVGFSRISQHESSLTTLKPARTVTHELGHNFGLRHDTEDCLCEGCLMAATVPFERQLFSWSSCSIEQMEDVLAHGADICLHDAGVDRDWAIQDTFLSQAKSPSNNVITEDNFGVVFIPLESWNDREVASKKIRGQCGNGIIEEGEMCDCGNKRDCQCCNPQTCQLRSYAQCAQGECCDLNSCLLKKSGYQCRGNKENVCDLPEYCDGQYAHCPADRHMADGVSCYLKDDLMGSPNTQQRPSHCFSGRCVDNHSQCKLLWGPTATIASLQCFQRNRQMRQDPFFNCGRRPVLAGSSFDTWTGVPCETSEDATCGRLWCIHENVRLIHMGEFSESDPFSDPGNPDKTAAAVTFDVGWNIQDPGLVPSGTPCGEDGSSPSKMCHNGRCVIAMNWLNESCHCNGKGVCNDLAECHCDSGFAPPLCKHPGNGGSFSSGPPPHSIFTVMRTAIIVVSIVAIIPLTVLFICFLLRQYPHGTGYRCLDQMIYCKLKLDTKQQSNGGKDFDEDGKPHGNDKSGNSINKPKIGGVEEALLSHASSPERSNSKTEMELVNEVTTCLAQLNSSQTKEDSANDATNHSENHYVNLPLYSLGKAAISRLQEKNPAIKHLSEVSPSTSAHTPSTRRPVLGHIVPLNAENTYSQVTPSPTHYANIPFLESISKDVSGQQLSIVEPSTPRESKSAISPAAKTKPLVETSLNIRKAPTSQLRSTRPTGNVSTRPTNPTQPRSVPQLSEKVSSVKAQFEQKSKLSANSVPIRTSLPGSSHISSMKSSPKPKVLLVHAPVSSSQSPKSQNANLQSKSKAGCTNVAFKSTPQSTPASVQRSRAMSRDNDTSNRSKTPTTANESPSVKRLQISSPKLLESSATVRTTDLPTRENSKMNSSQVKRSPKITKHGSSRESTEVYIPDAVFI